MRYDFIAAYSDTRSCYKIHHDTPGDANCSFIITAGGGCDDDDEVIANITCVPGGPHKYVKGHHAYRVVCNDQGI